MPAWMQSPGPPPFERPIQAPAPTPRSPGPRRPGDVLIAAASAVHEGAAEAEDDQDGAAEQHQQPGAHGSGTGQARVAAGHRGGGRPRADSAVSAARRLGPRPGATQHRPRPLGSAPAGSDPSQGALSPPTTSPPPAPALRACPRLVPPIFKLRPNISTAPPSSKAPPRACGLLQSQLRLRLSPAHSGLPGLRPQPSSSTPIAAPPGTRCPWQP